MSRCSSCAIRHRTSSSWPLLRRRRVRADLCPDAAHPACRAGSRQARRDADDENRAVRELAWQSWRLIEGILQVARYRNPDPPGFFFQKRRSGVDTRQILDLIRPTSNGSWRWRRRRRRRKRRASTESVQPQAQTASRILVRRDRRVGLAAGTMQYTVPDYFNGVFERAIAASAGRMGVARPTRKSAETSSSRQMFLRWPPWR